MGETRLDYLRRDKSEWEEVHVSLLSMKRAGIKDPAFEAFTGGVYSFSFAANRTEEIFFCFELPHSWKPGTTIKPHVHFTPASATSGVVRFGIEYTAAKHDGSFSAPAIIYGTCAASGITDNQCVHLTEITTTTLTASPFFVCRVFRTPTNGGDTYPDKVFGHAVNIHFQSDRDGTLGEFRD